MKQKPRERNELYLLSLLFVCWWWGGHFKVRIAGVWFWYPRKRFYNKDGNGNIVDFRMMLVEAPTIHALENLQVTLDSPKT